MAKIPDVPRPKTGVTPVRNVRVATGLWESALEKARQAGETITAVVVRGLERYVRTGEGTTEPPPIPREVYAAARDASRESQEVGDRIAAAVEATWVRAWRARDDRP